MPKSARDLNCAGDHFDGPCRGVRRCGLPLRSGVLTKDSMSTGAVLCRSQPREWDLHAQSEKRRPLGSRESELPDKVAVAVVPLRDGHHSAAHPPPAGIVPDDPRTESQSPVPAHPPRGGDSRVGPQSASASAAPSPHASATTLPEAVRSRRAPDAPCCSSCPTRDENSSRSRSSSGSLPRRLMEPAPPTGLRQQLPSGTTWSPRWTTTISSGPRSPDT